MRCQVHKTNPVPKTIPHDTILMCLFGTQLITISALHSSIFSTVTISNPHKANNHQTAKDNLPKNILPQRWQLYMSCLLSLSPLEQFPLVPTLPIRVLDSPRYHNQFWHCILHHHRGNQRVPYSNSSRKWEHEDELERG